MKFTIYASTQSALNIGTSQLAKFLQLVWTRTCEKKKVIIPYDEFDNWLKPAMGIHRVPTFNTNIYNRIDIFKKDHGWEFTVSPNGKLSKDHFVWTEHKQTVVQQGEKGRQTYRSVWEVTKKKV